jgi:hypothetical protein
VSVAVPALVLLRINGAMGFHMLLQTGPSAGACSLNSYVQTTGNVCHTIQWHQKTESVEAWGRARPARRGIAPRMSSSGSNSIKAQQMMTRLKSLKVLCQKGSAGRCKI